MPAAAHILAVWPDTTICLNISTITSDPSLLSPKQCISWELNMDLSIFTPFFDVTNQLQEATLPSWAAAIYFAVRVAG